MKLTLLAGPAHLALAYGIGSAIGEQPLEPLVERFPDGEIHVVIDHSVRGADVYLVQPTGPPVQEHLFELLLLADASRRAGAARLTAVVPYFGYARQDRRVRGREPVGARLVADLMKAAGLHRVVAIDLHSAALEGFFGIPLEHLSAVPLLADTARPLAAAGAVVVAPDLGAVKLARRYANQLRLPVAIVVKTRLTGAHVEAAEVIGELQDRRPIIIDDMVSTGGTLESAARALLDRGCVPEISALATHALLVAGASERLQRAQIRRLIATDSVPPPEVGSLPSETVSVAPLLADAVRRLHADESLEDLHPIS